MLFDVQSGDETTGSAPASHHDLHMDGRAEVWIAVAPEVAFAAVTDLTRMGEWSPENRGGEWLDGGVAVVGATFLGRNERDGGSWETTATVIEARPPERFAFRVATLGEEHGTDWRFELRADGDGTVVAESFTWDWTPLPDEGFRARVGRMPLEAAVREVSAREQLLRNGVAQTVARLKVVLEAG
jgi:hypothetical protein